MILTILANVLFLFKKNNLIFFHYLIKETLLCNTDVVKLYKRSIKNHAAICTFWKSHSSYNATFNLRTSIFFSKQYNPIISYLRIIPYSLFLLSIAYPCKWIKNPWLAFWCLFKWKKSNQSLEFLLCTMATPLKHAFLHFLLGGLETNLI